MMLKSALLLCVLSLLVVAQDDLLAQESQAELSRSPRRLLLPFRRRPMNVNRRRLADMKSPSVKRRMRHHHDNIMTETNYVTPDVVRPPSSTEVPLAPPIRIKPLSQEKAPKGNTTSLPNLIPDGGKKNKTSVKQPLMKPSTLQRQQVNKAASMNRDQTSDEERNFIGERRAVGGLGLLNRWANSLVKRVRPRPSLKRPYSAGKRPLRRPYNKGPIIKAPVKPVKRPHKQKYIPPHQPKRPFFKSKLRRPKPRPILSQAPVLKNSYNVPRAPVKVESSYGIPKGPILKTVKQPTKVKESYGPPEAPVHSQDYNEPQQPKMNPQLVVPSVLDKENYDVLPVTERPEDFRPSQPYSIQDGDPSTEVDVEDFTVSFTSKPPRPTTVPHFAPTTPQYRPPLRFQSLQAKPLHSGENAPPPAIPKPIYDPKSPIFSKRPGPNREAVSYVKHSPYGYPDQLQQLGLKPEETIGFVPTGPRNNFHETIEDEIRPDNRFSYDKLQEKSIDVSDEYEYIDEVTDDSRGKPNEFRPVFEPSEEDLPPMITVPPPVEPNNLVSNQAEYEREKNEDKLELTERVSFSNSGPKFAFPDFGMEDLMDMADIEKFFNENFFKKIPTANSKLEAERKAFMHGVPESGYEPTDVRQEPSYVSVSVVQPKSFDEKEKKPRSREDIPEKFGTKDPLGQKDLHSESMRNQGPVEENFSDDEPRSEDYQTYAKNIPDHFSGGRDPKQISVDDQNDDPWRDTREIVQNFESKKRQKRSNSYQGHFNDGFIPSSPTFSTLMGFQQGNSQSHRNLNEDKFGVDFSPVNWGPSHFGEHFEFEFGKIMPKEPETSPKTIEPSYLEKRPRFDDRDDFRRSSSSGRTRPRRRRPNKVPAASAPKTTLPFLDQTSSFGGNQEDHMKRNIPGRSRSRARVQQTKNLTPGPAARTVSFPRERESFHEQTENSNTKSTSNLTPDVQNDWSIANPPKWAFESQSRNAERERVRVPTSWSHRQRKPDTQQRHHNTWQTKQRAPSLQESNNQRTRTGYTEQPVETISSTARADFDFYDDDVFVVDETDDTVLEPGKYGDPILSRPHPTNPDYEYVYYYDYDESSQEEVSKMEKAVPRKQDPPKKEQSGGRFVKSNTIDATRPKERIRLEDSDGPSEQDEHVEPRFPFDMSTTIGFKDVEETSFRPPMQSVDELERDFDKRIERDHGFLEHTSPLRPSTRIRDPRPYRNSFTRSPQRDHAIAGFPQRDSVARQPLREPSLVRLPQRRKKFDYTQRQTTWPRRVNPSPVNGGVTTESNVPFWMRENDEPEIDKDNRRVSTIDKNEPSAKNVRIPLKITNEDEFQASEPIVLRSPVTTESPDEKSTKETGAFLPTLAPKVEEVPDQKSESPTQSATDTTEKITTPTSTTTTTMSTTTTTTTTTTTSTTSFTNPSTTTFTLTETSSKTRGFPFRHPSQYKQPQKDENPCKQGLFCPVSNENYPMKSVINIVVSEGPAVQGTYQQVIRDFPKLIGGAALWESKRRRTGSCETIEETLKPGWAKALNGNWVAVVNTNEYPQEIKTIQCHTNGEPCSMIYSRAESKCEQKHQIKRLMVVDPSKPEKGVYAEEFKIPTECACSLVRGATVFANPVLDPEDMLLENKPLIRPIRTRDPQFTNRSKFRQVAQQRIRNNDNSDYSKMENAYSMEEMTTVSEKPDTEHERKVGSSTKQHVVRRPKNSSKRTKQKSQKRLSSAGKNTDVAMERSDGKAWSYPRAPVKRKSNLERTSLPATSTSESMTDSTTTTRPTSTTTLKLKTTWETVSPPEETDDVPNTQRERQNTPSTQMTTIISNSKRRTTTTTESTTSAEDQSENMSTTEETSTTTRRKPWRPKRPKKDFASIFSNLPAQGESQEKGEDERPLAPAADSAVPEPPKVGKPIKSLDWKKKARIPFSSKTSTTTMEPETSSTEESSVKSSTRVRVPPRERLPTKAPTKSPLPPELKERIHIMRDIYRSQLSTTQSSTTTASTTSTTQSTLYSIISTNGPTTSSYAGRGGPADDLTKLKNKASSYYEKFKNRFKSRTTEGPTEPSTSVSSVSTESVAFDQVDMDSAPTKDEVMEVAPSPFPSSSLSKGTFEDHREFEEYFSSDEVDEKDQVMHEKFPKIKEFPSRPWRPTSYYGDAKNGAPESDAENKEGINEEDRPFGNNRHGNRYSTIPQDYKKTTEIPATTENPKQTLSKADILKQFVKTGVNDPRKIKAMLDRLNAEKQQEAEEHTLKTYKPEDDRESMFIKNSFDEPEESEEKEESKANKFDHIITNFESNPWMSESTRGNRRGSSSSSFYQKFAKNFGGRRPRPNRNKKTDESEENETKYLNNRPSSRKPPSYVVGSTDATTQSTPRRFTPKFTVADSRGNGYPTPRTFGDRRKIKMTPRTTTIAPAPSTTTTATTTTTTSTTTTTTVYSEPSLVLDTSNFLTDRDYENAYFDLEKIPNESHSLENNPLTVDTSSFVLSHEQTSEKKNDHANAEEPGRPRHFAARLPIRNVLDVFQELRLSFGRKTTESEE